MTTVAEMTQEELREKTTVEEKLLELLVDPDEGLVLQETIRERLLQQKQAVVDGERGEAFDDVIRRLGLD